MYKKEIVLQENELPAKINVETGEITTIPNRTSNIAQGKSLLRYNNFGIINLDMLTILRKYLSHTELSIVLTMIEKADIGTNSLAPLSNDTSIRQLAEVFKISTNTVIKTFKKLYNLGVYAQLQIKTDNGEEFWILNPYIYWKGKLKDDSIFKHFANTDIAKLL